MKKPLSFLSKTFYLLSFASLFLPTFVPSCSSEKGYPVCDDTASVPVDSSYVVKDTSATIVSMEVEEDQDEVSSEEKSIVMPDGKNLSFWGYLLISFNDGMIWIFVVSLFYGGVLKFMNRNHLTSAVLSLVGFGCLTAIDKNKIVWEFWIIYGISLLLAIINGVHYYRERRKLLLNKF